MSDTSLNKYLAQGDDIAEGAFTPDPVTGTTPEQAVLFVNSETPAAPILKWWDGANFVTVAGSAPVIAQVVTATSSSTSTGTTQIPADTSIPQNTEGTEFLTCAITPTNSGSTLIVSAEIMGSSGTAGRIIAAALFRDSTADAIAVGTATSTGSNVDAPFTIPVRAVVTAGSTSATTFKIRMGMNNSGTVTFNGTGGAATYGAITKSSIVITEVLP